MIIPAGVDVVFGDAGSLTAGDIYVHGSLRIGSDTCDTVGWNGNGVTITLKGRLKDRINQCFRVCWHHEDPNVSAFLQASSGFIRLDTAL